MKLQVTKPHKASFTYSIKYKKGDTVKIGREDPEMPGWYWCTDKKGATGWIPKEYLKIKDQTGTITQEYDTMELTTNTNETLTYITQVPHWTLCQTIDGIQGWVPTKNLQKLQQP